MRKLAVLICALSLLATPALSQAQLTETRPFKVEAGPYLINVLSDPSKLSLGTVDYTVIVTNSQTLQPVPDARVLIWARPAEGGDRGWSNALNNPITPTKYTARMQLDGPGVWKMSVEVSSALGRVEVEAPSQVIPKPRRSRAGSLVFIGVFTVLIGFTSYLVWTIRRNQKQREAADAG